MSADDLEKEVLKLAGEVRADVRALLGRLDSLQSQTEGLEGVGKAHERQLADLRQEIAVLRQQMMQLQASMERWGGRAFNLVMVLAGGVVTVLVSILLGVLGVKK